MLNGERPWRSVNSLYREALDQLLRERRIDSFSEPELADLDHVWRRLEPWPDAIPGLLRLKRRYIVATLSNADMAAVVQMTKHSDLPWDVILTAELARTFKPHPKVYQIAVQYLGLRPEEILMVASHKYDLRAAEQDAHLVARPLEFGPSGKTNTRFEAEFDLNVGSFVELAEHLGV